MPPSLACNLGAHYSDQLVHEAQEEQGGEPDNENTPSRMGSFYPAYIDAIEPFHIDVHVSHSFLHRSVLITRLIRTACFDIDSLPLVKSVVKGWVCRLLSMF